MSTVKAHCILCKKKTKDTLLCAAHDIREDFCVRPIEDCDLNDYHCAACGTMLTYDNTRHAVGFLHNLVYYHADYWCSVFCNGCVDLFTYKS